MKLNPILLGLAAALACLPPASAHDGTRFAPTPAGGVSWEVLAATEALPWVDANGANRLAPRFTPAVEALNGKLVTIAGYTMPDDGARRTFSLYASEVDCEFHASPGPNMRAEIVAKTSITHTPGPLVVRGRLELVRARQGGIFFRIHDAVATATAG